MDSVLGEIDVMKGIDCEHIVRYYNNYYYKKEIWISMEFCSLGSLSQVLDRLAKKNPPRGLRHEYQIGSVTLGVLRGLVYMHDRSIVHRDIKSDNILLTKGGLIKIADFGISRRLEEDNSRMHTMIGTPHYLAPEVVLAEGEGGYTSKVDIWALGMIILELADGRPPYADLNPMKVLFELANNPRVGLKRPENWSEMMQDFVQFCCKANPRQRPNATHMIKHPWLVGHEPILDLTGKRRPTRRAPRAEFEAFKDHMSSLGLGADLVQSPKEDRMPGGGSAAAQRSNMDEKARADRKLAIQYFNRGIALDAKGQHDEAIEMYTKALQIDPAHVGSYTNRGVSYVNKKDYDRAIDNFRKACELNPRDANSFVNVGVAYANKRDYSRALAAFGQALQIDPNHRVAQSMQRRCESDKRKVEARAGGSSSAVGGGGGALRSSAAPAGSSNPSRPSGSPGPVGNGASIIPDSPEVPRAVSECCKFLEQHDEVSNMNIFQEPGDTSIIQTAKAAFDEGRVYDVRRMGSHNVAGLLWLWFHELSTPLLTFQCYDKWLEAVTVTDEYGGSDSSGLVQVANMMPVGNRVTLSVLLALLSKIHAYQGSAAKLASFFAPVLLRPPEASRGLDPRSKRLVELLILHTQTLQRALPKPVILTDADVGGGGGGGGGAPSGARGSARPPPAGGADPFGYYEDGIIFKRMSREEAEEHLRRLPHGAYLIRPSSQPGALSCTYKPVGENRIGHLLLSKPTKATPGWTTDGRPKPYPTIHALLKSLPYGLSLDSSQYPNA